jgi:hypothetical protein
MNPSIHSREIQLLHALFHPNCIGVGAMQQVILRDQVNGRPGAHTLDMEWRDGVPLTPRILISERVRLEWEAHDEARQAAREAKANGAPPPLVDAEMMARVNTYRLQQRGAGAVTLESVTELAIEGFSRNAFFLIVDGRQIADLDEVIPLRPTSDVTFVRLIPLKGG